MSILGMLGQVLLASAIILLLFQVGKYPAIVRWTVLGISAVLGFFKIGDLRLIAYPGGVLGDLSITTQILLASVIVKQVLRIDILSARDRSSVFLAAAAGGLVLYPLSSGLTMLDIYSLGFESTALLIGLAVLAVMGWYLRPGAAIVVPVSVIAFNFGWLTSTNVWDYLLDPMLALFAWGWLLIVFTSRTLSTARATADSRR
jgi:hypothetical protein